MIELDEREGFIIAFTKFDEREYWCHGVGNMDVPLASIIDIEKKKEKKRFFIGFLFSFLFFLFPHNAIFSSIALWL